MNIENIKTFVQSAIGRSARHHPKFAVRGMNFVYHAAANGLEFENRSGLDILSEEWDNLVILDACRYDMFAEQSELPGRLESRISKGSSTTEFLKANFAGEDLLDTVYVTANPQYHNNRNRIGAEFHSVENVWLNDGWDTESGTVLPETVTEAAMKAYEEYPKKKLVIHYIQPHFPFINSQIGKNSLEHDKGELNIWEKLLSGELSYPPGCIWKAYKENLSTALPHVETLLQELNGRTVVTSDHGNMINERASPFPINEWGHPRGIYVEPLVKVPWLVREAGEQRTIVKENSAFKEDELEATEERLEQLGYK